MTQQAVIDKVIECVEKARQLYGEAVPMPSIEFFSRKTGLAGSAHWSVNGSGRDYSVKFNQEAIKNHLDHILKDTVPHEVAHIVNFALPATGHAHDKGWKAVCIALGGTGQRLHDLSLTRRRWKRPYVYLDTTGVERKVTSVIHRRIQKQGVWYKYPGGGRIDYTNFVREE